MLNNHSIEAKSGTQPEYLVIFFHGYHFNGGGMADLAGESLSHLLPGAKLVFPDAPFCVGENSYSWFDIQDIVEAPDSSKVSVRAAAAAAAINDYIDSVIAKEGIAESRVILAGYSQGATMAYYAALLRDRPVGGVYSLSGGALDLLDNPKSMPPVMLAAGDRETGSYSGSAQALSTQALLEKKGFRCACVILPDHGHDVSPQAMALLADFVHQLEIKNLSPPEQDNEPSKHPRRSSGFYPGC